MVRAQEVAATTIAEYDRMAEAFRRGTADHDVSQNIAALLEAIEGEPPHVILDLGCGPGRDLRRFTELGHETVGLDGARKRTVRCCTRTSSRSTCQPPTSTGSSRTPPCSMCRAASSPGFSATSPRP